MKRRIAPWQLIVIVILLVSVACNLGVVESPAATATAVPSATPLPLPPTIVETLPPIGSVVSPKSLFTIFFSEQMERASVEAALSGDFPGGFVFSWVDDATLTLAPKSALPADSKVTFSLASSAKSAVGLTLPQAATFSYQTPGSLTVAQTLPASGAVDVSPDSAVVVTFNQPVVPLGAAPSSLPAGLLLEPAAAGSGEWLNTSTYVWRADPGLAGGVQYTARVNSALVSANGMALDETYQNFSWSFNTALPDVVSISPDSKDGALSLDAVPEITFNQPMDRVSVEAGFVFRGPDGMVAGDFEWNKKSSVLKFKPASLLSRAAAYTLIIGADSRSRGGAALGSDRQITYQTMPAFSVSSTSFPNGQLRPASEGLVITFSSPLVEYSESELLSLVNISPKLGYTYLYIDGMSLHVTGSFAPGQTHTVTFAAGLKDRWGQTLGQDYIFSFKEPDAAPSLSLGNYLPVLFTRPDEPRISAQAVNVNNMLVSMGSVSLGDFLRFQQDYQFQQSYAPIDLQTWTVSPELPRNDNQPVVIDLSNSSLSPGLYFVNVDSFEVQNQPSNRRALVVSNLNVTFKSSASEVLIWAIDLRTQQPAQNIPVRLVWQYGEEVREIANGRTDERGLWRSPYTMPKDYGILYAVLGKPGDDQFGMAASDWNAGVTPWAFNLMFDSSGPRPEVYIYTERPVYRPGDKVYFRGILRNWYDGRYSDADLRDLTVNWFGPSGKIGPSQPVTLSAYGTFSGEFKLAANAAPGGYSMSVSSGEKDLYNGSLYFQVADYRKPEINLSVELSPSSARGAEPLVGRIKAEYFFGAPGSDLPFVWRLYTRPSYFPIPGYNTGVENSRWFSSEDGQFGNLSKSGEGRTAADGSFILPLDNLIVEDTTEVTLEITMTESGGFPVSALTSAIMHPDNFYVGVRPQSWVGKAGAELGFDLLSVDWDGKPVSKTLNLAFQKVRFERVDSPFGDYSFEPIYTPLETISVNSGTDGKATGQFTPADAGTYVLDVRSGDAHTRILLWVTEGENAEWPNLPYQQIQLTANQEKFKPGEIASVFIPNPFNAPALALLTTERSTFKAIELVTIPAEGYTFALPLTDEAAPNIYVAATLLGPHGVDFRQGYVNLPVEPSAFTLNVELKASPEKAGPGDTVTLDLNVSDSKGQPVQAEFSLAVVDLAALALADPNSVDIIPAFYDIQPLGVRTSLTAAIYTRRVLNFPGGRGGGGGEAFMTLRSKFPDTAYWKTDLQTDTQGKAQVTLTLPDNLTTWQVDTRGLTKDTRVGQARVRVVTSKELLIRPQTPRFLVVGDHAELAAMVNNTTSQVLDATVSLQAPGLILDDPALAEQRVSVPAQGRVRVSWSGLVQNGESIDAVFSVVSGSLQDAARPNDGAIPILRYSASQTFSTAGILAAAESRQEIIAIPRSFQPLDGNLQVELSPSLAAAILGSLKALDSAENPWSSEQVVSTFLPNLATYRALKESGLEDPELAARLQANLANDVRYLMTFRLDSAGWRWSNSSEKSDPYLTAYVLFGLQQAAESGLNLDGIDLGEAINNGRIYLFANADPFLGKADLTETWQANQTAFYCYVLEQTGGLNEFTSLTDSLYENRDRLDPWAKSMLAQTLYRLSAADERVTTLLSDIEASAIRSATGAHWESVSGDWRNPGTALFTTAVVLNAISERNPASPLAADAVRYLASQRDPGGRWASSYETAWVLMALNKYMQASGELRGEFNFSAELNGTAMLQGQASGPQNMTSVNASAALTQLNLSGANSLIINRQEGIGKLYYRAALTVDRPAETAPALERGLSVSRQYLDCGSGDCLPVTSYQMKSDLSGRVTVRLTLTLPRDAYYLILEDHIPAGADILDSSLKTSQQGQQDQSIQARFDPADPFGDGWGWWYFNRPQIFSSRILWSADYLPAGTYELTYTLVPSLAGEYRVLPARAWQAYFPEVQGSTAGALFEIKP